MKIKEKKIQKFLGLLLCFLQALAYVLSGMYGKLDTVGSGNATIIVIQVIINCILVIVNCGINALNEIWWKIIDT